MPSMPFMISDLALDVAERLSRITYKTRSSQSEIELAPTQNKSLKWGASGDVFNYLRCHPRLASALDDTPVATTEEPRLGRQAKASQSQELLPTSAAIEAIESKPIFTCTIEITVTPATPIIDEFNNHNPFLTDPIHADLTDLNTQGRRRAARSIDAAQLHPHWRRRAAMLEGEELLQEAGYSSDDEGDVLEFEWPASWDEGDADLLDVEDDLLEQLDALCIC